jgi:hypothetical protein
VDDATAWDWLLAACAIIGAVVNVHRHFSKEGGLMLSGVGRVVEAVGTTGSKIIGFVKGALWLLLFFAIVSFAITYSDWILLHFDKERNFVFVCIAAAAFVVFVKACNEIGPALHTSPRLQNQGVHGGERLATPAEGKRAARGEPVGSPTIDPQKLNY